MKSLPKDTTYFWILAHPDDELFALPLLADSSANHVFFYVTNYSKKFLGKVVNVDRVQESRIFFRAIKKDVVVLGPNVNTSIFSTIRNLIETEYSILKKSFPEGKVIFISTMYDGGHEEHITVGKLAASLSKEIGVGAIFFPTYKPRKHRKYHFQLMSTPSNPNVVPYSSKLMSYYLIRGVLAYASQWRSWIFLFVPVLIKYLTKRPAYREISSP